MVHPTDRHDDYPVGYNQSSIGDVFALAQE